MKKFLSVILAVMMAVSVFAISVIPAMAADTVVSPTASTVAPQGHSLNVNGAPNNGDISYTEDTERPFSYTFTYDGPGDLEGWENNLDDFGLVEGVDYTAVMNEDGSYTITFLTEKAEKYFQNDQLNVNAVVKFDENTTVTAVTNKNDSSKAPATGMSSSVVAGSVAVACAGVAVLAATKKKFSK